MKEQIEPVVKDQIKIVAQKEVDKKQKYVGKIRVIKGLTMYKLNLKTGHITKVQFDSAVIDINNPYKIKKKMIQEPGFIYTQALNDKNAKRKFTKQVAQIIAANKSKHENPIRPTL